MTFLSGVLGGVAQSLIGRVIGGLFGGGQAAPQAPIQQTAYSAESPTAHREGFWRGVAEEIARGMMGGQQQTIFDPQAALGESGGLSVFANQRGGMASPQASAQPGWNVEDERWPRKGRGEGRGGGEGKGAGLPAGLSTALIAGLGPGLGWGISSILGRYRAAAPQPAAATFKPTVPMGDLTSRYMDAYNAYMQRALAGGGGLPESAYQAARVRGLQSINAQAQEARRNLAQQMAQRGITGSGVMAQGLMGLEAGRTGAVGNLEYGLAQQGLEAARQAQAQAAGQLPALYGIQEDMATRVTREFLALKELELNARRVGLGQNALSQGLLSGLGTALAGYFSGGGSAQPAVGYAGPDIVSVYPWE